MSDCASADCFVSVHAGPSFKKSAPLNPRCSFSSSGRTRAGAFCGSQRVARGTALSPAAPAVLFCWLCKLILIDSRQCVCVPLFSNLLQCRSRGRSSLIIPSGGPGLVGWEAFRLALQRVDDVMQQILGQVGATADIWTGAWLNCCL